MKKYDCNKTLDYSHELSRMCSSIRCVECPIANKHSCSADHITQEHIDIVQKWSDEHPEAPKLTKRERAFLECLSSDNKVIYRINSDEVYVGSPYTNERFFINSTTFKFIDKDDGMSVIELLELEVEDED